MNKAPDAMPKVSVPRRGEPAPSNLPSPSRAWRAPLQLEVSGMWATALIRPETAR